MKDKAGGYNQKDSGTKGPGIHWNPSSVGDHKRGLSSFVKGVEPHTRKGPGAKK